MAEFYSQQLKQNTRRGMIYNAENCFYNGHPTLGYKPEEGKKASKKILIDPDTAPVVQRIFADYAGGKPLQVIMNELNDDGLRSVKGKKITINSLRNILIMWLISERTSTVISSFRTASLLWFHKRRSIRYRLVLN